MSTLCATITLYFHILNIQKCFLNNERNAMLIIAVDNDPTMLRDAEQAIRKAEPEA